MKPKKRLTKNKKKSKKLPAIQWFDNVEPHDFPAALSYLSLIFPHDHAEGLVEMLKKAKITEFKAKDVFRATNGLSLLGVSNSHVEKNIKKINKGKKMSPILLVRDKTNNKIIIADGYHRLCAVYELSEDISIPCKIV